MISAPDFRVALVSMPFALLQRPSIQLGLLRAVVQRAGFAADSHHLYVNLGRVLSPKFYTGLRSPQGHLIEEWLFSVSAFGSAVPGDEEYFQAFPGDLEWLATLGKDRTFVSGLRHQVLPAFIESCLREIPWSRYAVVGFTVTFFQTVASLALARRIKQAHPAVRIVFGGANVEGELGRACAEAFPFIDYVVAGEGENAFPQLLKQVAGVQGPEPIPGVLWRSGDRVLGGGRAAPVLDLDTLPVPDYADYFQRASALGILDDPAVRVELPFQSARGCWWGQHRHCAFCGLNGASLAYRRKTPNRLWNELTELGSRYGQKQFAATDNILDLRYITQLFPILKQSGANFHFFYEARANLTRRQIQMLRDGGVRVLQCGIESLSTHLLMLMNKGCSMLQNILTMKWCQYYGITLTWNLLRGFPGETEEDYRRQLDVLRLLSHLEPPRVCRRIYVGRFAPYFHDRQKYPISNLRPEPSYYHVFPRGLDHFVLARTFDYEMNGTVPESAHAETLAWVNEWRQRWQSPRRPALLYRRERDGLMVEDYRDTRQVHYHKLGRGQAFVYQYCSEAIRTERDIAKRMARRGTGEASAGQVHGLLRRLCRLGLMVSENSNYLSLALPAADDAEV